ncbi:MAG: sodium:proton antiporter [Proteobacteria bacterium]|nr:sodium:proton antiporter [Pseudomonadota bacterium]MBU1234080.1 sodium:proton antiporter [Pseudomonadota bacterium]MBU1418094.1 sodium:proton antiporter [Pseudomonadota bacterium]MBU1456475.1 sodium:proton antiporter [Pseudomonadota bacterium]
MKTEEKILRQAQNRNKRLDAFQRLLLFLIICLITALGTIIWIIPDDTPGLADAVVSMQEHSGVESSVTAVLLNFRGYDTLLEVMVLLLAVIGAWSLAKAPFPRQVTNTSPVQMGVVRLLVPLMFLVAAYLVWQGSHLAGGAFQGGAILGAAGVLLLVTDLPCLRAIPAQLLRIGLVLGPLLFVGVALFCLFFTGNLLGYPEETAGWLILLIEIACAISIGLTLSSLFAGGHPEYERPQSNNPTESSGNGEKP